jgi:O-methyltransferase
VNALDLYLDLMREALIGALWRDPPFDPWRGIVKDAAGKVVAFGSTSDDVTIHPGPYDDRYREFGLDWPMTAATMIGRARMDVVRLAVETVIREKIPGDLIETGVWRGGACIYMRAILKAYEDTARTVYVCDSFEGLPPKTLEQDSRDIHALMLNTLLAISLDEVMMNFNSFGMLDDQVVFVRGWFKDTLPILAPTVEAFAMIRLDGDMYESTMDALNALYPKLSPGGFCIIDDYRSVRGCTTAVDEYRTKHEIKSPIIEGDSANPSIYWRK